MIWDIVRNFNKRGGWEWGCDVFFFRVIWKRDYGVGDWILRLWRNSDCSVVIWNGYCWIGNIWYSK